MKITLLSYEYPPQTGFGGIGTYSYYHARALAKLGHEVRVLAGATSPTPLQQTEQDGVRVYRYRIDDLLMRGLRHLNQSRLKWSANRLETGWCMYHGLKSLLRQEEEDIVEMPECGGEGILVNHLLKRKTVVRFFSPARLIMPFYDVSSVDTTVCPSLEQIGISGATGYTSCARYLAEEARDRLGVRHPIRIIPNGIALDLFDGAERFDFRRKFGLPKDRLLILFSGRMERRKGIHLCPEIAASILERYDVDFLFAGSDLFGYLEHTLLPYLKTKKLKGSVHYLGKLNLPEIRSCVFAADIFLLTSLWDSCPYTCLEAMSASRAIVSSDQGGMPELIRDGENGLLAVNENPPSYVSKLEMLINDKALRERLGAAARRTVEERLTDVEVARQSVEFYRDVIKPSSPSKQVFTVCDR